MKRLAALVSILAVPLGVAVVASSVAWPLASDSGREALVTGVIMLAAASALRRGRSLLTRP